VERSLKMFKSRTKNIKLPDNGVIFCFGVDNYDNEVFEEIVPPSPVDRFYYRCDKRFHLDQYDSMFEQKPVGHVVFIDGKNCVIYRYNGVWQRIKHFDALLIKRQRKGGQSSMRFSRLAEESRDIYITHIVDEVNALILDNSINYVFGGEELKTMFLSDSCLKPRFKTESMYHVFTKDTINEPYFKQIMTIEDDSQVSSDLITLLDLSPEYLLFSKDEFVLSMDNVEYTLIVKKESEYLIKAYPNKKFYKLEMNDPYYYRFKDFDIICKLYYKKNSIFEIEDDFEDFV